MVILQRIRLLLSFQPSFQPGYARKNVILSGIYLANCHIFAKAKKRLSPGQPLLAVEIVFADYFIGLPKISTSLSSFELKVPDPNEPSD